MSALKKEEPYRYLRVPIGTEVEQHEIIEICEQLIIDLEKLENSLLAPWQKLDAIRTFLQPRLSYILRAGKVKIRTLQNYGKKLISALKRICHLLVRATNHYFFASQSAGGLGLRDPIAEVHVQKVIPAIKMLNCRYQNVKLTWWTIGDILYLSVVAGPLKLSERKMTCLNFGKCDLSLTPITGIFHGKPMAL